LIRASEEHLESILQRSDVWVEMLLHLKPIRDDLQRPCTDSSLLASLVAEPEIAGEFGRSTESVHETARVGFAILLEPIF
jgi:hypothetical protein